MFCNFCGSQVDDSAKFCNSCGNNLQAPTQYLDKNQAQQQSMQGQAQQQSMQGQVQHQQVDFIVSKKILSLRAVYNIKDSTNREFLVAKRPFFNPFFPHFYIKTPDGKPIGDIQGNFFRTEWKIKDPEGNVHATVRMPWLMIFKKHFDIETPAGLFNSGDSYFAYKFECFDQQGQVAFLVDKKILSLRDNFKIVSYGMLSPFVTTMCAICIDQRFFRGRGSIGGALFNNNM